MRELISCVPTNGVASFYFLLIFSSLSSVSSWSATSRGLSSTRTNNIRLWNPSKQNRMQRTALIPFMSSSTDNEEVTMEAVASSGLDDIELSLVMEAVQQACQGGLIACGTSNLISTPKPVHPPSIPGALGRVLILNTNLDVDSIEIIQFAIAEQMDQLLYSETPSLNQPVLISMQNNLPITTSDNFEDVTRDAVMLEVQQYEMAVPLAKYKETIDEKSFIPSLHLKIDGAYTEDEFQSTTVWDTSAVIVFDDLINEDLRLRLLNITLGRDEPDQNDDWDDAIQGPNPNRWVRGGLLDIPDDVTAENDPVENEGPCWGLRDEAVEHICFEHHDAIEEFEAIMTDVFPQFVVTRLPEAVFGSSVSPLTANAPTAGDIFNYHIDGDPKQAPPSPWTDVYGRYPNRIAGKPRFMSCLVYLDDDWDGDEWGSPTRFLDIPTDKFYDVIPRCGRCVFMDQDVSHTVVSPNAAAGKRPRYSLVWKLILHPRTAHHNMDNLAGNREWPEPIEFGSARQPTV